MLYPHPPLPGARPAPSPTLATTARPAGTTATQPAELPPDGAVQRAPAAASGGAEVEFMAVFERQLSQCRRYGQPLAVLAIGIERVATLEGAPAEGLPAAVSHELWNRLRARTRAKDTVLRLSEREFAVLLPGCRVPSASGACARLAAALGGVYALGPGPVLAVVSLGLANLGTDGDSAAPLWQAAVRSREAGRAGPSAAPTAEVPGRQRRGAAPHGPGGA